MTKLLAAASLDAEGRAAAAGLIVESFDRFYDSLGAEKSLLGRALAEELLETGTELEFTKVLAGPQGVAGVMAAYPADQMSARQRAGMFHLLSALPEDLADELMDRTAEHAATVSPVPADSYYLARLAVALESRGTGLADVLMQALWEDADGRCVSLHVHCANERAISFYHRHGFERTADDHSAYLCMTYR